MNRETLYIAVPFETVAIDGNRTMVIPKHTEIQEIISPVELDILENFQTPCTLNGPGSGITECRLGSRQPRRSGGPRSVASGS